MTEFKAFRQTPVWAEDEVFQLTGKQLKAIQDMFKAYTPFVQAIEPVFTDALDAGKITIKYEDMEGNPMSRDEVTGMLQEHARLMAETLTTQDTQD